jgi:hypothetical protein
MKTAPLLLALLVAAAPLAGIAQSQNEMPTNLPGITTTAAPPEGFNPLTATDEDLAYYGFPPRPNDYTGDYESWAKAMAASRERIVPVLEQTNIYHGPAQKTPGSDAKALQSSVWSGYVKLGSAKSYGKSSYYYVYSEVTVPTAKQAPGECTLDGGAAWVGIDGWNSDDVPQDGIEFDDICNGKIGIPSYSVWFEWFPLPGETIVNFPIAPGQEFFMEIWNTSSTVGHAYLENVTKKLYTTVAFDAPAGTSLIGNSAEWITERPSGNNGPSTLTNYGSQKYSDAHGETFSGKKVDPGDSTAIIMLDNNGKPISYPTRKSSTSFEMKDEGSAK